jgi:hypothetical protein
MKEDLKEVIDLLWFPKLNKYSKYRKVMVWMLRMFWFSIILFFAEMMIFNTCYSLIIFFVDFILFAIMNDKYYNNEKITLNNVREIKIKRILKDE